MKCIIITKRKLMMLGIIALAVVIGGIAAVSSGKVTDAAAANRLLPIYCVDKGEQKLMSISFDAAWGNEDTPTLIQILDTYNVKATFFVVGDWADKYPESVKQLADAGHEIMNHSDTHPHMPKLSRQEMGAQIDACNEKIEAITGKRPVLFRPPYGEYSNDLIEVLREREMYCVQWDVDSLDWKNPPSTAIADRVNKKVKPGSIALFHNAAVNTPAALPAIIEHLQSEGYTLVPISELIYHENYTINHEGKQMPETAPSATGR